MSGKQSSTPEREGMAAHSAQAKSRLQTGISRRNIPSYSRNGIGKRIAKRNLKTLLLDLKARSGGNVRKVIHGKRLYKIVHVTRQIYAPSASNRMLCEDNSLAQVRPDIAKDWHPHKNAPLTPNDVVAGG